VDVISNMSNLASNVRLKLHGIYNRGTKVFPVQTELTEYIEHWQCRFVDEDGGVVQDADIRELLDLIEINDAFYWMHVEKIFNMD